jgi:hypothetical protein
VCIKEWGGRNMEDLSFEEVRLFLRTITESGGAEFDVVLKKCR